MSHSSRLFLEIREMDFRNYDDPEPADYSIMDYIESLIDQSSLETSEKEDIRMNLPLIEWNYQAYKLIGYLKENQPNPILSGRNYSQTDITSFLKIFTDGSY